MTYVVQNPKVFYAQNGLVVKLNKKNLFEEEKAQVAFEYLLTAVFGIILTIGTALILETLRQLALKAQTDFLNERTRVIENLLQ